MAKILLIEADRLLAKNLSKVLKRGGHQVDWQVDPQAAMDSADKLTPDLIILDLVLAGHGGLEFLYELRSYPEWQGLPVILYSQVPLSELDSTQDELADLNIAAFHHKATTTLDELAESVDKALTSKTATA